MADTPPFRITPDMLKNPDQLAERLNRMFEKLFREKRDRPVFSVSSGGVGI